MSDFVIALAGGAVGTLLIGGVAAGLRVLAAWREIDVHDRAVHERNEDLELGRGRSHPAEAEPRGDPRRTRCTQPLLQRRVGRQISEEKERALLSYRDQERDAERDVARIKDREGWLHEAFRGWRRQPFPNLEASTRAQPVFPLGVLNPEPDLR